MAAFEDKRSMEGDYKKASNLALAQGECTATQEPDAKFVDELDKSSRDAIYRIANILFNGVVAWAIFKAIYLYLKYPSIQDWFLTYLNTKDKNSIKVFPITWHDFLSGSYASTTQSLLVIGIITVVAALSIAIIISPLHTVRYDSSFIALYTWSRAAIYTGIVLAAIATSIATSQIFGLIDALIRNTAVADWVVALSLLSLALAIGTVALASTVASWQSAQTITLLRRAVALKSLEEKAKNQQFDRLKYPVINITWRLFVLFIGGAFSGIITLILSAGAAILLNIESPPRSDTEVFDDKFFVFFLILISAMFGLTSLWAALFAIRYRIGKRTPLTEEDIPKSVIACGLILLILWILFLISHFLYIFALLGSLLAAYFYIHGIKGKAKDNDKDNAKFVPPKRVELLMWRLALKYTLKKQKSQKK